MSKDATAFISGENHPFCAEVMERDKVYDMLIQPDENIDGIACACAQLIFQGLHKLLQKAMKEQLPGGRFYDASANLQQQTQSVIPHNKIPERVFGILDFFLHYRPNYTTITNEVFLMFVFNKTLQWLESLLDNERESVIKDSIKDGRKIREKYIERLREIENNRKVKLREKQVALENKQRNLLKKSQSTPMMSFTMAYGKIQKMLTKYWMS